MKRLILYSLCFLIVYQVWKDNYNPLQKAVDSNFLILNKTQNTCGSGTHFKYKNKLYVLTCQHLKHYPTDRLVAVKGEHKFPLVLVKQDKINDLALYELYYSEKIPYTTLADNEPNIGQIIYSVGNPNGTPDIISEGIIAKNKEHTFYSTCKVFFGCSGGSATYQGKLIGVFTILVSLCRTDKTDTSDIVTSVVYSEYVNLKTIKNFLNEI